MWGASTPGPALAAHTQPGWWNQRPPPPAQPSAVTWEGGRHVQVLGPGFPRKEAVPPANPEGTISTRCQDSHPSKRVRRRATQSAVMSFGTQGPSGTESGGAAKSPRTLSPVPAAFPPPGLGNWRRPGPAAGAAAPFVTAPGPEKGPFVRSSQAPGQAASPSPSVLPAGVGGG